VSVPSLGFGIAHVRLLDTASICPSRLDARTVNYSDSCVRQSPASKGRGSQKSLRTRALLLFQRYCPWGDAVALGEAVPRGVKLRLAILLLSWTEGEPKDVREGVHQPDVPASPRWYVMVSQELSMQVRRLGQG